MTTLNSGTNWSPRLAIYGDMGSTNVRSLPKLMSETDAGNFDAILHVGKSVELYLFHWFLFSHISLQVILPMTLQR